MVLFVCTCVVLFVIPYIQAAEEALNVLTKKDMAELKAYAKPPALVELTLSAVMTVLRRPPTWDESKKQLGDPAFMTKLLDFDKDKLDDAVLKKIGKFTQVRVYAYMSDCIRYTVTFLRALACIVLGCGACLCAGC